MMKLIVKLLIKLKPLTVWFVCENFSESQNRLVNSDSDLQTFSCSRNRINIASKGILWQKLSFKAIRLLRNNSENAALPYDVMSSEEARIEVRVNLTALCGLIDRKQH